MIILIIEAVLINKKVLWFVYLQECSTSQNIIYILPKMNQRNSLKYLFTMNYNYDDKGI